METRNPPDRRSDQTRSFTLQTGVNRYAEGSALVQMGHTHILCTASIEKAVPQWLAGKEKGWITAEYSMLPRSTHSRTKRDRDKLSGRTQEIQRLIGRALRSMVDLKALGERSILVDCDVLQADGGTRTAAISGGCVALGMALGKLIEEKKIPSDAWIQTVAAVSIGLTEKKILVDLDYAEDSSCDVDMNFVINGENKIIEIQGTAEKAPFSLKDLSSMTDAALMATEEMRLIQLSAFKKEKIYLPFLKGR